MRTVAAARLPEITVVIPTRNRWQRLYRTLRGVLGQLDVDLEAIIVDDGSDTPAPREVIDMIGTLGRIKRLEVSRGVSAARNIGIKHSRAAWVAFLDDDDLWAPRKLRRQIDVAHREKAVMAFSSALVLNDELGVIAMIDAGKEVIDIEERILTSNPIPGGPSNVIARTDVLRRLGGFDRRLALLADWDMWIRLLEAGRIAVCREVGVGYVMHNENWIVANSDRAYDELEYLVGKHERRRTERGVELDVAWFSEWVASGYRRAGRRWAAARLYLHCGLSTRTAGNLARGMGVILGERAMAAGRRLRGRQRPIEAPEWIELYR